MSIKLICAGDLMTGENVHHYHRGIIARFKGRYNELIKDDVREKLRMADILLFNFESSLASSGEINKMDIDRGVYVAPLESLDLLMSLGNNIIVSIANNHFGQHGAAASKYTIEKLEEKGIGVIGKDHNPLLLEREGHKLAFYAASLIRDKHYEGAYFKSSYEYLIRDLNLPDKEPHEIRVISLHWGEEYFTIENNAQKVLAEKLSQCGFDYIIGHHPHVVQPVKPIGNTKVFYSHGNFIFDQNFSRLTQTGLVSQILLPEGRIELFLSQQKAFQLVHLDETDPVRLENFCADHFHPRKPLMMRIRMKLELLQRFHELNGSILKKFFLKMFRD